MSNRKVWRKILVLNSTRLNCLPSFQISTTIPTLYHEKKAEKSRKIKYLLNTNKNSLFTSNGNFFPACRLFFLSLWLDASAAPNHVFNFSAKTENCVVYSIRITSTVWSGIYEIFLLQQKNRIVHKWNMMGKETNEKNSFFFVCGFPWTRMCWLKREAEEKLMKYGFLISFPKQIRLVPPPPKRGNESWNYLCGARSTCSISFLTLVQIIKFSHCCDKKNCRELFLSPKRKRGKRKYHIHLLREGN